MRGPRLLILGKQGSGKGTQADRLAHYYDIEHISTGEMLRAGIRAGSEMGIKAREYMDVGNLVPDEVVIGLVDEYLRSGDALEAGFILDGFPRTAPQAVALDGILRPSGLDAVLVLDVTTDEVVRRISSRRVCQDCGNNYSTNNPPKENWTCDKCGGKVIQRDDDKPDAVIQRLALYEKQTKPLIDYYQAQGLVKEIDATGDPDEVFSRIHSVLVKIDI